MTDRELETAVPEIRHDPKRTAVALMLIGLVIVLAALLALWVHSWVAAPPIFR